MQKIIPLDATLIPDHADLVFSGVLFDTFQWQQPLFDGTEATFEMLRRQDTVVVVPIVDDKIIILEEEQPHHGKRVNLPGGRVDDHETNVLDAAKRELHEETGFSFESWKLLKVTQPFSKIEWFLYLYVAWGSYEQHEQHIDGGEKINVTFKTVADIQILCDQDPEFLHEVGHMINSIVSPSDLTDLPEFTGKLVDR